MQFSTYGLSKCDTFPIFNFRWDILLICWCICSVNLQFSVCINPWLYAILYFCEGSVFLTFIVYILQPKARHGKNPAVKTSLSAQGILSVSDGQPSPSHSVSILQPSHVSVKQSPAHSANDELQSPAHSDNLLRQVANTPADSQSGALCSDTCSQRDSCLQFETPKTQGSCSQFNTPKTYNNKQCVNANLNASFSHESIDDLTNKSKPCCTCDASCSCGGSALDGRVHSTMPGSLITASDFSLPSLKKPETPSRNHGLSRSGSRDISCSGVTSRGLEKEDVDMIFASQQQAIKASFGHEQVG